jgi:hypothetical protein
MGTEIWSNYNYSIPFPTQLVSDSIIYKRALTSTRCLLRGELSNLDDIDILPVDEHVETVPEESRKKWWRKNLGKKIPRADILGTYSLGGSENYN